MATFKADVFSDRQIFKNAGHHFTGRSDAVSNILLSELLRYVQGTVTALFRQVHEHIGHPAIHILQRQALYIGR